MWVNCSHHPSAFMIWSKQKQSKRKPYVHRTVYNLSLNLLCNDRGYAIVNRKLRGCSVQKIGLYVDFNRIHYLKMSKKTLNNIQKVNGFGTPGIQSSDLYERTFGVRWATVTEVHDKLGRYNNLPWNVSHFLVQDSIISVNIDGSD